MQVKSQNLGGFFFFFFWGLFIDEKELAETNLTSKKSSAYLAFSSILRTLLIFGLESGETLTQARASFNTASI